MKITIKPHEYLTPFFIAENAAGKELASGSSLVELAQDARIHCSPVQAYAIAAEALVVHMDCLEEKDM